MATVTDVLDSTPVPTGKSGLIIPAHSSAPQEDENPVAISTVEVERLKRYWPAIEWLPVQISIALPIPRFRVRDLL
ncbi:MAG: hypothetical protein ABI164_00335, partial [Acidobacteriaceae bacterium]